jgi:hypothetical protein
MLSRPIHSPDLPSAAFVYFLILKTSINGTGFEVVSSIQEILTNELKAIRKEAFPRIFVSLYERFKRLDEAGWEYIKLYLY